MNTYYAVVNDGFIQYNMRDGCLQVFEDKSYAESEMNAYGGELMPVSILKSQTARELLGAIEGYLLQIDWHANDYDRRRARERLDAAIAKAKS